MGRPRKSASPFRYFNSSPEVIRLVVVLEGYVTRTRDKEAALTFIKKVLKRHRSPDAITTDGLRSYGAAMRELGNEEKQEVGRWANNRWGTATCRSDDGSG